MKNCTSPVGKVFSFNSSDLWSDEIKREVHLPKIVRAHMVIVIEKFRKPGWVRVATV
jgi:hypothetical protein